MQGIQNLDLDNENFIDTVAFDQCKMILENSMDELSHYLKMFNKGEYTKFPKSKAAE